MAAVTLDALCITIERTRILDALTVSIADGAFVAIVGPSGVGKSTLLRAIAGLVPISSGTLAFDDHDVTRMKAADRDIGMVFQSPALLPRRTALGNVRFPLEVRRELRDEIGFRVNAEVRAMGIEHLMQRRPDQLSRGEKQLVQIARTMVRLPRVLLLDEPFAPLDAQLRVRMRSEIGLLQSGYGVTTVMATNDPHDAMSLASMIVVLGGSPATIDQIGRPGELYADPCSLDVASATGPLWTITATVERDGSGFWLHRGSALRLRSWSPMLSSYVGREVLVGVRGDDLVRDDAGEVRATLRRIIVGPARTLACSWNGRPVEASGHALDDEVGTELGFRVVKALVFDPVGGHRIV